MDETYFWILILFSIILILSYSENYIKNIVPEQYTTFSGSSGTSLSNQQNTSINGYNADVYFRENNLMTYNDAAMPTSVNLYKKTIGFTEFGASGIYPPFMKCPSCELQFDCSNYPHKIDDSTGTLCTNCLEKQVMNNENRMVLAKSNGSPRECKSLYLI